jgi:hypothetical protein
LRADWFYEFESAISAAQREEKRGFSAGGHFESNFLAVAETPG